MIFFQASEVVLFMYQENCICLHLYLVFEAAGWKIHLANSSRGPPSKNPVTCAMARCTSQEYMKIGGLKLMRKYVPGGRDEMG